MNTSIGSINLNPWKKTRVILGMVMRQFSLNIRNVASEGTDDTKSGNGDQARTPLPTTRYSPWTNEYTRHHWICWG